MKMILIIQIKKKMMKIFNILIKKINIKNHKNNFFNLQIKKMNQIKILITNGKQQIIISKINNFIMKILNKIIQLMQNKTTKHLTIIKKTIKKDIEKKRNKKILSTLKKNNFKLNKF